MQDVCADLDFLDGWRRERNPDGVADALTEER